MASFTRSLGNMLGVSPKKAKAPEATPEVPNMANTTAEADAQLEEENKRRALYGKSSTYMTSGGAAGLANTGTVSTSGLLGS